MVDDKYSRNSVRSPEQYAQRSGALRATRPGRCDAQTPLLRQPWTTDQVPGTIRPSVRADQPERHARARVVHARRFRVSRALGRIRVAVDAAHSSRRVAADL